MNKGFMKKIKDLQKKHEGKIVLVRIGIFFCGIGKDAVILNKLKDDKNLRLIYRIADFCYQKLVKGDTAIIYGKLSKEMKIIIQEINIIQE